MRELPGSRHTPIIFLTAYPRSDQEMVSGYELGAVDFLLKPILPQVLRAKVSVFVELARRNVEVARQIELLREQQSLLHERRLEEERRRWEEESLRGQRDEARRTAEALALKTQELAATIEEKERVERELIQSNQALAAADRRKDEFLAVLGHELRNPLAPLMAGLEILKRGLNASPVDGTRLHRTRQAMGRQLKHLSRLVDDLLDVQRINSGKIELRKETVGLREVIEQAVATVRPALEEREHELSRGFARRAGGAGGRRRALDPGDRQPAQQRHPLYRAGRPDRARRPSRGRRGAGAGDRQRPRHPRRRPAPHLRDVHPGAGGRRGAGAGVHAGAAAGRPARRPGAGP